MDKALHRKQIPREHSLPCKIFNTFGSKFAKKLTVHYFEFEFRFIRYYRGFNLFKKLN